MMRVHHNKPATYTFSALCGVANPEPLHNPHKAFHGYSGCDKCFQEGVWRNKITYPETKVRLSTDSSLADMGNKNRHIGKSPLSGLVKMVSMFPTAYMYLLNMSLKGKHLATRVCFQTVESISGKLTMLSSYMPCEFNHKPKEKTAGKRVSFHHS